jgi:hypothetical protein
MGSVIVGRARTPISKMLASFKDLFAAELGGYAIAARVSRQFVVSPAWVRH